MWISREISVNHGTLAVVNGRAPLTGHPGDEYSVTYVFSPYLESFISSHTGLPACGRESDKGFVTKAPLAGFSKNISTG